MAAVGEVLPEAEALYWRPRVDAARLRHQGRLWTLSTAFHVVPFTAVAALLMWAQPLAAPVALAAVAHAWIIPELYAYRGASVLRPKGPRNDAGERDEVVPRGGVQGLLEHHA